MTKSSSTEFKAKDGGGDATGFRASDKPEKKKIGRLAKGALMTAFGAAALGGGIMLADMTRDDSARVRTLSKGEFSNATLLGETSLFFGPDSRQYQSYQRHVQSGEVATNDDYIRLSDDLITVYQVSPAVSDGINGVKYTDITDDVKAIDYNNQLVISNYMTRQFTSVLRQLSEIDDGFDPETGVVKVAATGGGSFSYHIFADEDGVGQVRIISDDYRAANMDVVNRATVQMRDMGVENGIWDHASRWDAYVAKVQGRCATVESCRF